MPDALHPATPIPTTVDAAVELAFDGLDALVARGEEIDDEWQYVQDLHAAWHARLTEVAAARAGAPIDEPTGVAIVGLVGETGRVHDPHRAIDWLSTFPQAVLLALEERP